MAKENFWNYDQWDVIDRFDVHTAATLWMGANASYGVISSFKDKHRLIGVVEKNRGVSLRKKSKISRDELLAVAEELNQRLPFLYLDERNAPDLFASSHPNQSKKLLVLLLASSRFWKNADPHEKDTWPKSKDVEVWLESQGFSVNTAQAGATIIRPDWTTSGRRPKE